MGPRNPAFAERMAANRNQLAAVTARIDMLETQLACGRRRITEATIDRFGEMLAARLRDNDSAPHSAYLKMFVSEVRVSDTDIVISGPIAALEAGVCTGTPSRGEQVPNFERECCLTADKNGHSEHWRISVSRR